MSSTTVASRAYAVVPARRSRWSRGGASRPSSAPAAGSARHRADASRRDRAARSPDPQPAPCGSEEEAFVAVSMYARWLKPHPSAKSSWSVGCSDSSAHRICLEGLWACRMGWYGKSRWADDRRLGRTRRGQSRAHARSSGTLRVAARDAKLRPTRLKAPLSSRGESGWGMARPPST